MPKAYREFFPGKDACADGCFYLHDGTVWSFYKGGFLDEWDYWAGTFGLVVLALVESVLFMWVFGPDNAWEELHHGALIRLPVVFKYVMTYVTPVFLIVMMLWWTVSADGALPRLLMHTFPESEHATRWSSRAVMLGILVFQLWLIRAAWQRRARRKGGVA